jgi:hypothetical protein
MTRAYIEKQDKVKAQGWLEPGMEVIVTRKAEWHEGGWLNSWADKMDKFIGKTATISKKPSIRPDGGIRLLNPHGSVEYCFPYFVLVSANKLQSKQSDCNSDGTLKRSEYNKDSGFEFL